MARYDYLRRLLNPAIVGDNINSWLKGLAEGDDFLDNNASELFKSLFAKTATGEFLNIHGSNVGIPRPNSVGISDTAYRRIITETPYFEISRNAILNVLDIYFDTSLTRAFSEAGVSENYTLEDGLSLDILIDEKHLYTIVFNTADFSSISSITALELSSVISQKLKEKNSTAFALAYFDASGQTERVRLFTNTLGSAGSVRITGGTANNSLQFDSLITTTESITTEFKIENYTSSVTHLSGITTRFTWTGGQSPGLSAVKLGDYVNVSGNQFNTYNQGSFTITNVVNGSISFSYFEINNANSVTQTLTVSNIDNITFFRPLKKTVFNEQQYAALIEGVPGESLVFIPATTSVIERTPTEGGAYISEIYYTMNHSSGTFTSGETVIGSSSNASGILSSQTTSTVSILGNVQGSFITGETLLGEQSRVTATLTTSVSNLDNLFKTNYLVNLNDYIITNVATSTVTPIISNNNYNILTVNSTNGFITTGGYLYFNIGYNNEEQLVPYRAILNTKDILLDSSYKFVHSHPIGSDLIFIKDKNKYTPPGDDSDKGSFLTDLAIARNSCVSVINRIKGAGLSFDIEVKYPSDIGLGNQGKTNSDILWIFGE